MNACQGVDVYLHSFLTSSLDGSELLPLDSGHFITGGRDPSTHWLWSRMGPTIIL